MQVCNRKNLNTWQKRSLETFSEYTLGGGTPKTSITKYWKGKIPWLQSSNLIQNNVSEVNVNKFISEQALANSAAKLIPNNSIAVVTRVGVGKLTLMNRQYASSQDFLSFVNLKYDKQFSLYSMYKKLQQAARNGQGTSIKGITKNDLLALKVSIPLERNEQTKIGNLIQSMDLFVAVNQRKVDLLKEVKKTLLQNMFV
ncbi:MAG TPA: restriction endonuclease subunit S [Lactobacillus sp.]|nr:restriction endonuclease subunit S [Lactobacillus sp.]